MQRRTLLRGALIGGAMVSAPAFLAGCASSAARIVAAPLPEDPFLDWFAIDRGVLRRAMSALGANGAEAAEIYLQHRRTTVMRLHGDALIEPRVEIIQGAGLRVRRGATVGFASTEVLTAEGLIAAAQDAAGSGQGAASPAPADFVVRPEGELYRTERALSDVGLHEKLSLLEAVDDLARARDPAVTDVDVSWSDTDERILIATLAGAMILDRRPMTRLSVQITMARDDQTQVGFANVAARADLAWYTEARIAEMVTRAVERTEQLFDARRPPSGEMPVILASGTGGVVLHEAIGHAFEADFVRDRKSPYADRLGERIADGSITIIDQGTLRHERGALNYDDEGTECGRNVLVEGGVLRGYLHDRVSAGQFGVSPTGSARCESYRHQPIPRMTCTFMEDGAHERAELIEAMGRGIIAETFTGGTVELGNGDFSFVVRNGWLVEKGRILMPVRDLKLVGNGPATLADITMVANDGRLDSGGWTCGKNGQNVPVSQGMPSVLVSSLAVRPLS